MSYSLDVNLLLYASDTEAPLHDRAQVFLRGRADDWDLLCLTW